MSYGCNIGSMTSGICSSSLHGYIWMIFCTLGVFVSIFLCTIMGIEDEKPKETKEPNDEKKEAFILNRLVREGHNGTISKLVAGVYEYRISLRDPKEIIPWIRSFGERAQVISSGDFEIEKTIEEDWEKAVNKYEALSRI